MSYITTEEKSSDHIATKFKIGSIVTLLSHPVSSENDSLLFGGDPNHVPPFMVIIETIVGNREQYDPHTGSLISDEKTSQCKCLWYSRDSVFEETWISSKHLKIIRYQENDAVPDAKNINSSLVTLRTMDLESKKLKISLNQKNNSKNDSNKSITALLNYVPPVMQVIGTAKYEIKEPLNDPKTGKRKRFVPSLLIKCKYYNYNSTKVSEVLIPIEAIRLLPAPDTNLIDALNKVILDKGTNNIRLDREGRPSLLRLDRIVSKFGRFFVDCTDVFTETHEEIALEEFTKASIVKSSGLKLPRHDMKGNILNVIVISRQNIDQLLGGRDAENLLLKIEYKDLFENRTSRYLRSWRYLIQRETIADEVIDVDVLEAECLLRNDKRFFRIDRIQRLEVVDLEDSVPLPSSA